MTEDDRRIIALTKERKHLLFGKLMGVASQRDLERLSEIAKEIASINYRRTVAVGREKFRESKRKF